MKRLVVAVLLVAVAGCGDRSGTPAGPPEETATPQPTETTAEQAAPMAMTGQDMNLFFFDKQQTGGEDKPSFSLFSRACTLDAEGVWSFKEASAVIYSRQGEETQLTAGEGRFDKTNERASLGGGVTVHMGAMQAELQDMQWLNEERVAQSDNPVTIREGETLLSAATFRFHPDDSLLVLTDVTGELSLEETPEQ